MRKVVNKSSFIKTIICIVAAILIIGVWPTKIIKENVVQANPAQTEGSSLVVNYINNTSQIFMANYDHIQYVDVLIKEGSCAKQFKVQMFDTSLKLLATQTVEVLDTLPSYAKVLLDVDTVKGDLYTLRFSSVDSLYIGQEPWYNPETIAVSYYNDTLMEGMNLVMDYEYQIPLRWPQAALFIGIVILLSAVLLLIVEMIYKKEDKDSLISVESGLKWVLNPLVAIVLLTFVMAVFMGAVTPYLPDKIFALIGAFCTGLILFYAINHDRLNVESGIDIEYIREHFAEYIQAIAIAGAIQACCEYVSALYDIHHYVAERKQLLWFALIIIAMFGVNEILIWYNLLYFIITGIAGVIYYKNQITTADPALDEQNLFVLKASIAIAILLGFILIRTIKLCIAKLKNGEAKKLMLNKLFIVVMLIYMVLIVVFRNTRYWTLELVISFGLLFINYLFWEKKTSFVLNVIRGVVIQFSLCTFWVWLHRPYSTYRCARYTHFFHTETVTATYLTMVSCVAIVLVLRKVLMGKHQLKEMYKELCFFGVVMTYLIFTMARTAIFASGVAIIFALIFMIGVKGKNNCILLIKTIGWLILSVVIVLPAIFEIQRTLPCLVSEPYEYDIDDYEDEIMRGRQLNKTEYMTIGRWMDVFLGKLVGVETHFDSYHNSDLEYDEYHATYRQIYERIGYTWPGVEITDDMWDTEPVGTNHSAYLLGWDADQIALNNQYILEGKIGEWDTYDSYAGAPAASEEAEAVEAGETGDVAEVINDVEGESAEEELDYTNGRISIYKSYISQLNMTGHDTMGALLDNGEIATHAHDVYLQVAYDHGIPTAIVFVIFGLLIFINSIMLFVKNKENAPYLAVAVIVFLGFAVAGVVEWTYNYSHPMAFVVWLLITPLLSRLDYKNGK